MDAQPFLPPPFHLVWHRTLRQMSDQVRRLAPQVRSPVHVFDIRPQVMRGLYSVALATRGGELHRCVAPYRDPRALADDRMLLEKILCWRELEQVEGRIELGVNTGELLRYFLPSLEKVVDRPTRARAERGRRVWLEAAAAGDGPVVVRRLRSEEDGEIGCISRGGVHWLLRLGGQGRGRLAAAATHLGCAEIEAVDAGSALYRDVMGEWQS